MPPDGKYSKTAIIHNWIYDNALRTKKEADLILLDRMTVLGVNHIDELTGKQIAEAMEYLAGKVLEGELLPKDQDRSPLPSVIPRNGTGRVMLYLNENGQVKDTYPLTEDQVVMSFDAFVSYFRKKGWIVAPRDEVAKGIMGAIQILS